MRKVKYIDPAERLPEKDQECILFYPVIVDHSSLPPGTLPGGEICPPWYKFSVATWTGIFWETGEGYSFRSHDIFGWYPLPVPYGRPQDLVDGHITLEGED